jgi:hypothetical protein
MFTNSWTPQRKKFVDVFLRFFPVEFLETVIAEATSRVLLSNGLVRTMIGEMLRYIHELLHEAPRLLLETGNKDARLRGQRERNPIVHLQQVHVAALLLGHHIGTSVHDVDATNHP